MMAETRAQRKFGFGILAVAGIILAALAFILFNVLAQSEATRVNISAGSEFPCTVLSVYDGDGPINCAEIDLAGKPVSVRLRGIEAREADNSCRHADLCPAATGQQAKEKLTQLAVGRLDCVSFGPSYNRVDARCISPTGVDISCEMIRSGMASRWPQYDPDERLVACIPPPR
jgi:endonuclease YncB( thermonuclease family)